MNRTMKNKETTWQNAAEALNSASVSIDSEIKLTIDTTGSVMTIDLQKAVANGLR